MLGGTGASSGTKSIFLTRIVGDGDPGRRGDDVEVFDEDRL